MEALEFGRIDWVERIFRDEQLLNAAVKGGALGSYALGRRGYVSREVGMNRGAKIYDSGDRLLHLCMRNGAEPCFIAELIARGARTDLKNDKGELPEDIDRGLMDLALTALEIRPRQRIRASPAS